MIINVGFARHVDSTRRARPPTNVFRVRRSLFAPRWLGENVRRRHRGGSARQAAGEEPQEVGAFRTVFEAHAGRSVRRALQERVNGAAAAVHGARRGQGERRDSSEDRERCRGSRCRRAGPVRSYRRAPSRARGELQAARGEFPTGHRGEGAAESGGGARAPRRHSQSSSANATRLSRAGTELDAAPWKLRAPPRTPRRRRRSRGWRVGTTLCQGREAGGRERQLVERLMP